MEGILFFVYVFLGDRANRWFQRNVLHVRAEIIYDTQKYILNRFIEGMIFGWASIPLVFICKIFGLLGHKFQESSKNSEGVVPKVQTETFDRKIDNEDIKENASVYNNAREKASFKAIVPGRETENKVQGNERVLKQCKQGSKDDGMTPALLFKVAVHTLKETLIWLKSILTNKKYTIPVIAIFVFLCRTGLIIPVLILALLLFIYSLVKLYNEKW